MNKLNLSNSQASWNEVKKSSEMYQKGYQRGWYLQPEQYADNPDYMEGYRQGWNDRSADQN